MLADFLFVANWLAAAAVTAGVAPATADFVGRSACTECHADQTSGWTGSDHDLAMQPADETTVLGDFADIEVTHYGITSTFFKKNGRFMVRTEGPDGKLQDYEIKYTFGVRPLQQYLVEFPGGRLQALNLAWDTRPETEGGQRWFGLYPDERIAFDDELHWTRPSQNWNSMCAECHSTDLKKNYDADSRTFSTTWSEIDVSCEACHGPGSNHLSWAKREPGRDALDDSKGLVVNFDERRGVVWQMNEETGNAVRSSPRPTDVEIETCARCHSRRSPISENYDPGKPLLDQYLPSLLTERLYFADGQIDDEVYVYGSFLQSEMYDAGVTCSDCHDPHSMTLRAPGNAVCAQCHLAEKYDSAAHHFHEAGSPGASCVECHMPPRTYMVVDPRHDHSMRIPRPDLSAQIGTPNACNNCHRDKDAAWAAAQIKDWYGKPPSGFQSYARAFNAARDDLPGAGEMLATQAGNRSTPSIAKATALAEIGPYLSQTTVDAVAAGAADPDPLVRASAMRSLDYAPAEIRVRIAFPLLSDPTRAVRIEAARVLAPIPAGDLSEARRSLLQAGIQEYVDAQMVMAERPEAHVNLGILHASMGDADKAIEAYRTALEIDPAYIAAYVNMADVYRATGDEAQAEKRLRQAIGIAPANADVRYALGLSLVRQQRTGEALDELRQAAELNPGNAHYAYVYGVALHSSGEPEEAVAVLEGNLARHPYDRETLSALVAFNRDMGNAQAAQSYEQRLRALTR